MSVEVDTGGIDDKLKNMVRQSEKVNRKVVQAAAKYVAERLEENTPYEDESKYRSWNEQFKFENENGQDHKEFKHMKEDVHVSVGQDGEATIGYGHDTYWRVHFVETGTMRTGGMVDKSGRRHWGAGIEGQHFVERTTQETQDAVFGLMAKEIKKAFGL